VAFKKKEEVKEVEVKVPKLELAIEEPILTSLGFHKSGGLWVVYKLKTKGNVVLSVELSEGDTRGIALEEFKKKAVTEFLMGDV
jgi:hypothetical protein